MPLLVKLHNRPFKRLSVRWVKPKSPKGVGSLGAPSHRKGVFDGVGIINKHKVHSLIKATKTSGEGVSGLDSGYVTDVKNMFQAAIYHFKIKNNCMQPKAGSSSIDHYQFFSQLIDGSPIPQPPVYKVFYQLGGHFKELTFWSAHSWTGLQTKSFVLVCRGVFQICNQHFSGVKHNPSQTQSVFWLGRTQQQCTASQNNGATSWWELKLRRHDSWSGKNEMR